MNQKIDRRNFPRFAVSPSYTPARLRRMNEETFRHNGHVYDISEGGVRFEMDYGIDPGTPVSLEIMLPERPGVMHTNDDKGRAVLLIGNIIWCDDEEPGPVQMAVATTRFARSGDRDRLIRHLTAGVFARVA